MPSNKRAQAMSIVRAIYAKAARQQPGWWCSIVLMVRRPEDVDALDFAIEQEWARSLAWCAQRKIDRGGPASHRMNPPPRKARGGQYCVDDQPPRCLTGKGLYSSNSS
jgi:hypothetical protein